MWLPVASPFGPGHEQVTELRSQWSGGETLLKEQIIIGYPYALEGPRSSGGAAPICLLLAASRPGGPLCPFLPSPKPW